MYLRHTGLLQGNQYDRRGYKFLTNLYSKGSPRKLNNKGLHSNVLQEKNLRIAQ
jgi:hypothetical protein